MDIANTDTTIDANEAEQQATEPPKTTRKSFWTSKTKKAETNNVPAEIISKTPSESDLESNEPEMLPPSSTTGSTPHNTSSNATTEYETESECGSESDESTISEPETETVDFVEQQEDQHHSSNENQPPFSNPQMKRTGWKPNDEFRPKFPLDSFGKLNETKTHPSDHDSSSEDTCRLADLSITTALTTVQKRLSASKSLDPPLSRRTEKSVVDWMDQQPASNSGKKFNRSSKTMMSVDAPPSSSHTTKRHSVAVENVQDLDDDIPVIEVVKSVDPRLVGDAKHATKEKKEKKEKKERKDKGKKGKKSKRVSVVDPVMMNPMMVYQMQMMQLQQFQYLQMQQQIQQQQLQQHLYPAAVPQPQVEQSTTLKAASANLAALRVRALEQEILRARGEAP
ncbi:hypothetical protein HDU79_005909 [Rhizoclosmatium sp. JEL0117]|nr:hypothetical protein HDU79_005909 [Rhizoclosmatium sp. JEL0117]